MNRKNTEKFQDTALNDTNDDTGTTLYTIIVDIFHYAAAAAAKSLHSCLTLCNPIDGSPPGSPVPGILPARVLEWVAIAFSDISLYICPNLQNV